MSLVSKAILATLLSTVIVVAWIGYKQRLTSPGVQTFNMTGAGAEQLPEFSFPDIDGKQRKSSEWQGKILVINFWATWCPPCREEMPLFIELQKTYADKGIQFISIAIDEPNLVRDFYDVYSMNFPTMIGGVEGIKLANTLGNRFDSLPFTAIFDRNGKSHYVQAGQVTREVLVSAFEKLLNDT